MDIILGALLNWLVLNANMDIKTIPTIAVVSRSRMIALSGRDVYGLYDRQNKTIYLLEDLDLEEYFGKSVLLHELVHHYQQESGLITSYLCIIESERLAYETQRSYLLSHKQELPAELGKFNILMRSTCPNSL